MGPAPEVGVGAIPTSGRSAAGHVWGPICEDETSAVGALPKRTHADRAVSTDADELSPGHCDEGTELHSQG